MPPARSNLFRLASQDRVECQCGVCDRRRVPAFRDISTGWKVCKPCVEFVLVAERALNADMEKAKVGK